MKYLSYLSLFIIFLSSSVDACKPPRPSLQRINSAKSMMIVSENKHYLLKLIPSFWVKEKGNFVKKKEGYGLAFKIRRDGQLQYLWGGKGLYPNYEFPSGKPFVFISNDGNNVIKIKRLASEYDNEAVVIYRKGKAIKMYKVTDIIQRPDWHKVCNLTHLIKYDPRKRKDMVSFDGTNLVFTNIFGKKIVINLRAGKIL